MHLTTFPQFPLFPIELRLKIWTFALTPRTTSMIYHSPTDSVYTPSIPPLLHTTRESRQLALKHYTTTTTTTDKDSIKTNDFFFFNYSQDTLKVDITTISLILKHKSKFYSAFEVPYARVERVVIDGFSFDFGPGAVMRRKTMLPALKEFTVVECLGGFSEKGELKEKKRKKREIEISNSWIDDEVEGGWEGEREGEDGSNELQKKKKQKKKIVERMPILKCEGGVRCEEHWWFETWNAVEERRVESWCEAFHVVKRKAWEGRLVVEIGRRRGN